MKRMKRLVAFLVALATLASLCAFSIPASAEDAAATPATVTVTDEDILRIEKLEALGVIDASYDPATYVTRRKMADIIVKYMNITPSANTNGTPFRDVTMKDSSFASICTLYNMGIVTGDDQLRFNPDDYVSYDQALVFIVNAIGHKMFAEREGGYPTGYHRVAIKHDMLKGLAMQKGTDPVHFPDLYKMLEAALDAATVVPQYYGDGSVTYTLSDTDTYLYETYGIRKYHGIVTGNENTKLTSADSYLTDEQIEIDGQLYDTPGYVYDYFLGYAVDYFVKVNSETDAEMIYIEEARNYNDVTKIDVEDILAGKTTADRIYYTDEENTDKEYHITFDANFDVIYNRQCWAGYGSLVNTIPTTGYIEALDNNNDGDIDVLFIYEYRNVVVQSTNSFEESVTDAITGDVINVDSVDNEVRIHYAGETKKRNFNSIAKDSVISILMSKGSDKVITIYISTQIVEGKITGYNSETGYEIGDASYEVAYNYYGTPLAVGLEGAFYLDMNDDIVTYEYVIPANDNSVLGIVAGIQLSKSTLNPEAALKIFAQDGTFVEANLSDRVKIDGVRYDMEDDTERRTALQQLAAESAPVPPSTQYTYTVTDVYLIKYTTASDGTIATIDTGAQGGEGNINSIVTNRTDRFLGRGDMVILKYGESIENKIYTRVDTKKLVVFYVPTSDKIGDDDLYEIKKTTISGEKYYGPGQSYLDCNTYSAYSLGVTEIPMVDVLVCKTGSATSTAPTANSNMGLITDVSTTVNEYDEPLPKLYVNGDEPVVLAKTVKVWDSVNTSGLEYADSSVLFAGPNPILKNGVIIQYETNFEGYADRLTIVAEYSNGILTKKTNWTAHNGQAHHTVGESANSQTDNVLFGEVIAYDADAGLIQVKFGSGDSAQTNIAFKAAGSVFMYITSGATPKMVSGKLSDIGVGDKFIAKLGNYFNLQTMIILR